MSDTIAARSVAAPEPAPLGVPKKRYELKKLGDAGAAWLEPSARHRLAVVFVHGWGGDFLGTWTWSRFPSFLHRASRRLLFDQLAAERDLGCDLYSVAHSAKLFARPDVHQVGQTVGSFLQTYVLDTHEAVALVGHSLGGLAARQAILDMLALKPSDEVPVVGLLMLGTPNDGAKMARAAGRFWTPSARSMETYGEYLRELNRCWTESIVNGGDPAREPDRRLPLLCWAAVGESDAVVTPASAAHLSLLGEIKSMPKNHRGLAKAESRDDPPCAVVLDFIEKCRERMIDRRFRLAAERASAEFRGDLLRHDWTEEEEEHIVLAEDPAGANGERPLRCSVRNVRRGGRFRRELAICFRREQVAVSGKPTDFDIVLGRGLMEDSAYGRVVLSLAAPDLRDRVKSLRVSIAGSSFEYAPVRFESGRHWAIQTYGCTGAPEGVARYDEMTIETETVFDRSCGWYHYFSPRTIIDALVVDLTAPFPIRTRIQFGARSRDAKLSEQPLGDTHFSQVVVRGPVPRRSTVDWYFMD